MYLCATSQSPTRLQYWWNRMVSDGIEPDSWAYHARILAHGLMNNIDDAVADLCDCLPDVARRDPDGAVMLVNSTMWLASRAGVRDTVVGLYAALRGGASHSDSDDDSELLGNPKPLELPEQLAPLAPTLAGLTPSRTTYALLVRTHAHHGDLVTALTILRDMLSARHVPGADEYLSLFRGFARFGVVPPGRAGEATDAFPLWRDVRPEATDIASLWSSSGHGQFTPNHAYSANSMWTQSTLEELFATFMGVPATPVDGLPPRAPAPNAVYFTLLAFARVTNADVEVVRGVFDAMTRKFGPGNADGWAGWREDKRLRKIRERVGAADPEDL
jgi:pentatricopeptide repeat protein